MISNKWAKANIWSKKRKSDLVIEEGIAVCRRCHTTIKCTEGGTSPMTTHRSRPHSDIKTEFPKLYNSPPVVYCGTWVCTAYTVVQFPKALSNPSKRLVHLNWAILIHMSAELESEKFTDDISQIFITWANRSHQCCEHLDTILRTLIWGCSRCRDCIPSLINLGEKAVVSWVHL